MPAYFYAKVHHSILNDPQWGMLPDAVWRKRVELEILANETPENDDGVLPPISVICWRLHITKEQCEEMLEQLSTLNIVTKRYNKCNESLQLNSNDSVTWLLTDFHERQRAATNTERQTHFRARKGQNSNNSLQESNETVTNRYHSLNINISNISKVNDDEFNKLWNLLFTSDNQKLKNALQRDYKGADIIARMSQWSEAKERGLVDLNDKQLYRRIQWDNDAPQPDADIAQAVEQSSAFKSVEPTAEEAAIEIYRQMVASPLLKHRPMSVKNGFTPVSANGKLILEYVPGSVPEKFLEPLRKEFETACYDVAGIGVELSEKTSEDSKI